MNEGFTRSIAFVMRQEWPYMSSEGRERTAKRNPEAFRMSGLRTDAPQLPAKEEPEVED